MQDHETTQEVPVTPGQAVPANAATTNGDWWAAGSAPHRPTVGTIPVVRTNRSFVRSAVMPGLMMICGAVVMVASTMPWITANFLHHMSYVSGTDKSVATAFGINGWTSLAAGCGLVVLSGVMLLTDDRTLRIFAGFVAALTLALCLYELIRVLQQIHYARQTSSRLASPLADTLLGHVHVGYGLVVLVAAAGVGFFAALLEGGSD